MLLNVTVGYIFAVVELSLIPWLSPTKEGKNLGTKLNFTHTITHTGNKAMKAWASNVCESVGKAESNPGSWVSSHSYLGNIL